MLSIPRPHRFRHRGAPRRSQWGRHEYASLTEALRASGYLGVLKTAIGVMCLSMLALAILVQFHPLGPPTPHLRVLHAVVAATALVVGPLWIFGPWPSHRSALGFVAWADVSIAVCGIVLAGPAAQINTTIHMGLVGVFAAFLLGWRVLAVHCAFASAVIFGMTAAAILNGRGTLLDLFIYYSPALTTVILLPVILQAVIEAARRTIRRTAREAIRDPLTGLLNRRGMHNTVRSTLDTQVSSELMVVAVIDLDRFKQLNSTTPRGTQPVTPRCSKLPAIYARSSARGAIWSHVPAETNSSSLPTSTAAAAYPVSSSAVLACTPPRRLSE
nr:diguanylate cyclase [Mycobacterium sp. MS1601]